MGEQQSANPLDLSRRGFLKLGAVATIATTAITMMPSVADGVLVPNAYGIEGEDTPWTVFAVKPYRVLFKVRDVSDPARPVELKDAKVIVRSLGHSSRPQVWGTTDSEGNVSLNISRLCPSTARTTGVYETYVEMTVIPPSGYRNFQTGRMYVKGGHGYEIATMKSDGNPYPRATTLDGFDAGYQEFALFLSTISLDNHEFKFFMEGFAAADAPADPILWIQDKGASSPRKIAGSASTIQKLSDTCRSFTFVEQFGLKGGPCALTDDCDVYLTFTCNKKTYKVESKLTGKSCWDETSDAQESLGSTEFGLPLGEGLNPQSLINFKIPDFLNSNFSLALPSSPIHFMYHPAGYGAVLVELAVLPLYSGIGSYSGKSKLDEGVYDDPDASCLDFADSEPGMGYELEDMAGSKSFGERWMYNSVFGTNQIFGDKVKNFRDCVQKKSGAPNGLAHQKLSGSFDLDLAFRLAFWWVEKDYIDALKTAGFSTEISGWDSDSFLGLFDFDAELEASGSVTEQFMLGPVPLFAGIDASLGLDFNVSYQASLEEKRMRVGGVPIQEFKKLPGQTSIGLNIPLSFIVSVGAGVKGFASVGFSGGIALGGHFTWLMTDHVDDPDRPDPHRTFSMNINTTFFVQAVFAKWSVPIYHWNWPCFASNWTGEENRTPEEGWNVSGIDGLLADIGHDRLSVAKSDLAFASGLADGDFMLGTAGAFAWLANNAELVSPSDLAGTCEAQIERPSLMCPADERDEAELYVAGYDPRFFEDDFDVALSIAAVSASSVEAMAGVVQQEEPAQPIEDVVEEPVEEPAEEPSQPAEAESEPVDEPQENADAWVNDADVRMFQMLAPAASLCSVTATNIDGVGLTSQTPELLDGGKLATDTVCFDGVFSDDRLKVVQAAGRTFMFRIASVAVDGGSRPRLYASTYDKSAGTWTPLSQQPDFEIPSAWGFTRAQTFDYDFDVCANGDGSELLLLLTSGYRVNPDAPSTLEEAVQCNIFTCMRIDSSTMAIKYVSPNLASRVMAAAVDAPVKTYHSISCPRIIPIVVEDGTYLFAYYSFLHRVASDPSKLLSDEASCSVAYGLVKSDESGSALVATSVNVSPGAYDLRIAQAPSETSGDRIWATDTLVFYVPVGETAGKTDMIRTKVQGSSLVSQMVFTGESFADIPQVWPGHAGFLCTENGRLTWLSTSSAITAGSAQRVVVDNNGFDSTMFAVDGKGEYVYFISSFDGPVGYDYSGDSPVRVDKKEYRISAAKCFQDAESPAGVSFCRPFTFATTTSPIDKLVSVANEGEETVFFYTEITSAQDSKANLHCLRVPHLLDAKVVSFSSVQPYIMAGAGVLANTDPEEFHVTLENTGNTGITGFTAAMYDSGTGNEVNRTSLATFGPDNMVLNVSDMRGTNPSGEYNSEAVPASQVDPSQRGGAASYSDSKRDGFLMPGERATFKLRFKVPADWEGKKSVFIKIPELDIDADGVMFAPAAGGISGLIADETLVPYVMGTDLDVGLRFSEPLLDKIEMGVISEEHILTFDRPDEDHVVGMVEVSDAQRVNSVSRQLVTVEGDRPSDPKPPNLPKTGDSLSPLLVATGLLGAGLLAYSKRRMENEEGEE